MCKIVYAVEGEASTSTADNESIISDFLEPFPLQVRTCLLVYLHSLKSMSYEIYPQWDEWLVEMDDYVRHKLHKVYVSRIDN